MAKQQKRIFTLDVSKWVCGMREKTNKNKFVGLGKGYSAMLNDNGYMCCLGQFANQKRCIKKENLLGKDFPKDVSITIDKIYDPLFVRFEQHVDSGKFQDTELTDALTTINDDSNSTPITKIKQIAKKLKQFNISLQVIDKKNLLETYIKYHGNKSVQHLLKNHVKLITK